MFRLFILFSFLLMTGCDSSRIYETNRDFEGGLWPISDTLTFDIQIPDTTSRYNVLLNVRNTIDFETARLFVQYQLLDSGKVIRQRLVEQNLFDKKTGKPFGESGLGDIYTHQFLLEPGISFPGTRAYQIRVNHMMRTDTLNEIRSIGIRVEKAIQ
jgi:gliding motility-associated lipoprotein GldH